MSEATSYPFNGSGLQVLTQFSSDSPGLAITGITRANPPVVTTASAHGRQDGDVARLRDILGMTQLNKKTAIIEVISATTFALMGFKGTTYKPYLSGGHVDFGEFSDYCQVTSVNRQGAAATENETSTVCTVEFKDFKLGLGDPGTTQMDYLLAPFDPVQAAIAQLEANKAPSAWRVLFIDDEQNPIGTRTQLCQVQQTSDSGQTGGRWTGSVTFRNSGRFYDFQAD